MFSISSKHFLRILLKHKNQSQWSVEGHRNINDKGHQTRKDLKYIEKCHVAIVGLGGVGKSLAHLLKMYPIGLTELRLCNRSDPQGMVEELSHIPTKVPIRGFQGMDKLAAGLRNVDIVVMSAGSSRKQNAPRQELFRDNALICMNVINVCAEVCPHAFIAIVTNPVDSLVPIAAEVLKKHGAYRREKLFGICHLDQMRAQRFYAEVIGAEPMKTYVPVVGGHSEFTTVPLFSKSKPHVPLTDDETMNLVQIVRTAGSRVVQAKKGSGGSTYSMASAAMYFVHKLCRAIHHEPHIVISAYVESSVSNCRFFSNELIIDSNGILKNLGYGKVTDLEQKLIDDAVPIMQRQIAMAEEFVADSKNWPLRKN